MMSLLESLLEDEELTPITSPVKMCFLGGRRKELEDLKAMDSNSGGVEEMRHMRMKDMLCKALDRMQEERWLKAVSSGRGHA